MKRPVVRSIRGPEHPFAPIVVTGLRLGLSDRDALRAAKAAVQAVRRFRHFDFRGFRYDARTGRATFV